MSERIQSPDSYYAPWEKIFGRILTPFEEFIHQQAAGGIVLIGCAVLALVLANGPLAEQYADLLHVHVTIGIGGWELDHSLHHWINDGLSRCLGRNQTFTNVCFRPEADIQTSEFFGNSAPTT